MDSLPDLRNQLSQHELFLAFKKQLTKDFELSNCPFDFIEGLEPDFESIREQISATIRRAEDKSDFTLMQLLYRVDIGETQLKRRLLENKSTPYHTVLAELIIKRILQKVVVRQYFKNKQ